jgi:Vitamin B12 dependent methionine synthase, activation domain
MREVTRIVAGTFVPDRRSVLRRMGMDDADDVPPRVNKLIARAADRFADLAVPAVLLETLTRDEFAAVYRGDGANAADAPLDDIVPRANRLALFTATLGGAIGREIHDEVQTGDPALGYVLDVTASDAADRLAYVAAERFRSVVAGRSHRMFKVLPYSPGYCGWHVSGQRALFDRLRPVEIDVILTSSCLMDPLKSVSGVLVAGAAACHRFRSTYPFCDACASHACRARIATVK